MLKMWQGNLVLDLVWGGGVCWLFFFSEGAEG